jgi:hypothetical protein
MRLPRAARQALQQPATLLLGLGLLLAAANLGALIWLYALPLPDMSRAPQHEVGPAR